MIKARFLGGPQHDGFIVLPAPLPVWTVAVLSGGVKFTGGKLESLPIVARTTTYLLHAVVDGLHIYLHRSLTGNPRDN